MKYFIRWCGKRLRFFFFSCHARSRDFVEASTTTMPHHSMYDNHNHNATATATTWQPTAIVIPTPRPWGICKREDTGRLGMTKTGPNNMRCVIWALGEFFFFFFFFLFCVIGYFIVFIGCIYNLSERETVRTTGRIKMGPNDVRCVVWALGEFFCFLFRIILY